MKLSGCSLLLKSTYETEIILLPRLKGHIHVPFDVVVTACNTQNAQSKQSLIIYHMTPDT